MIRFACFLGLVVMVVGLAAGCGGGSQAARNDVQFKTSDSVDKTGKNKKAVVEMGMEDPNAKKK